MEGLAMTVFVVARWVLEPTNVSVGELLIFWARGFYDSLRLDIFSFGGEVRSVREYIIRYSAFLVCLVSMLSNLGEGMVVIWE